jgi:hypothetical protein
MSPSEYFDLADNNPVTWQKITGQRLTHKIFGAGTILSISLGRNAPQESYLLVKFDNKVNSIMKGLTDTIEFSLSVFNDGIITKLSLSAELIKSIRAAERVKLQKAEEERKQRELEALAKKQKEDELKRVIFEKNQRLSRVKNEQNKIIDILDGLIKSTKEYISLLPDLKRLNDVFSNHCKGIFVYSDVFEQRLYLLRYFYAYYYEYRKIMERICNLSAEINVVSIGCGGGVDALALKNVSNDKNKRSSYIGIDIEEWEKGMILYEDDHTKLHNVIIKEDTENYLKDATVLFFPKSLSDITVAAMQDIEKWINKCVCTKEEICIAASFIYTSNKEGWNISGKQYDRYNKIIELFKNKNYREDDAKRSEIKKDENSTASIWKVDDEVFKNIRPKRLIDFIFEEISNTCKKYNKNKIHCNICKRDDTGKFDYVRPKLSAAGIHCMSTVLRK